jgi:asparagine synthase (glutamine-hydrolysing)
MCGIFGILNINGQIEQEKFSVPNETAILKHRGPDDFGYFIDSHIYMGHRRLSIIDLVSGRQPICNEDETLWVIFNGEIYNFIELRKILISKGHTFITNTDTEVILHAYEQWGNACVGRFRVMFAFAIWDQSKKTLFIARDRLGIKPLFYAFEDGLFYFASEMKGVLQYKRFPREIDYCGLASYFTLSYIPAPLTIFKHIHKLLPGHTLEVKNRAITIHQYWDIHFQPDYSQSEGYFIDGFMNLLTESVDLRLISDVPLGAFLSGGIDSGTVVALMSNLNPEPVRSFSMGFGGNVGGYLDEREYARQVASMYGTLHSEKKILPNFKNIIEDIIRSFDEPFADHSTIPSFYLCKTTREEVTVALSGLGGDELFGGYERYLGYKMSTFYNRLPWFLRENVIRQLVEKIPERTDGHYTVNHLKRFVRSASLPADARYLGFLSMLSKGRNESLFSEPRLYEEGFEAIKDLIFRYFNTTNATELMDRVFYCDIKTYLPEDILACTDRMSMRHGLEVRVPFLDHKLVEFCATIPHEMKVTFGDKKNILKKAVKDILPKGVISHRKQGFVGPMTTWLQTDLKPFVLKSLQVSNLNKHGIFNNKVVNKILDEHFNRLEINDKLIWSLVMFQAWYDMYRDHQ